MLKVMRENARSWVVKVLLFLIISVFVFWGVSNFKESGSFSTVAEVNGASIDMFEFSLIYNSILEEFKLDFELDEVPQSEINRIKKLVLERLINRKLIVHQALEMGLSVKDKELINSIKSDKSFLKNGVFDISYYRNILDNLSLTPNQFENFTRESLLVKKFTNFLYKTTKVSDVEFWNWYSWYNSQIALEYIFFDPSVYSNDIYDIEKVVEYFDRNRNNYKSKCLQKLRIAVFDPDDSLDKLTIDETEIVKYFDSNPALFVTKKTVNVSHILIKNTVNSRSNEEARKIAEDIANKARMTGDFSRLARIHSECASAQTGGELGKVEYDMVVKPFAEAAFSMRLGEISSPIKTKFGWHIIRVNAINPEKKKTLNESREKIVGLLSKTKADSLAYNEAKKILEKCFSTGDLVKYAKLSNVKLVETDWFSYEGPSGFEGNNFLLASLASDMDVGQIGDICKIGRNYCILQLVDRTPSKVMKFEEVENRVLSDFKNHICYRKAGLDAKSFIEITKKGVAFKAAAELYGLTIHRTGYFTRGDPNIKNATENKLAKKGLKIYRRGDILSEVIEDEKGFYVISLLDVKKPSIARDKTVEIETNNFRKILVAQKQANYLLKLLEKLRNTSEITVLKKL